MIEYKLIDEVIDSDNYANNHVLKYAAYREVVYGDTKCYEPLTVENWIEHMIDGDHSKDMALNLTNIIKECPFKGLRFETKGINKENAKIVQFEFVLVNDDGLYDFAAYADQYTFADQLAQEPNTDNPHGGVFSNLGNDSTLVCPKNYEDDKVGCGDKNRYGHLAVFLRKAPIVQIQEVWKMVAETYRKELDDRQPSANPVWLSTAGGGVRWLHFRFDERPKYYRYEPFKKEVVVNEKK